LYYRKRIFQTYSNTLQIFLSKIAFLIEFSFTESHWHLPWSRWRSTLLWWFAWVVHPWLDIKVFYLKLRRKKIWRSVI